MSVIGYENFMDINILSGFLIIKYIVESNLAHLSKQN